MTGGLWWLLVGLAPRPRESQPRTWDLVPGEMKDGGGLATRSSEQGAGKVALYFLNPLMAFMSFIPADQDSSLPSKSQR